MLQAYRAELAARKYYSQGIKYFSTRYGMNIEYSFMIKIQDLKLHIYGVEQENSLGVANNKEC